MIVHFTITLRGTFPPTGLNDQQVDSLFLAGCDDATICYRDGMVYLVFYRECGNDPDKTVEEAQVQILKAGFGWSFIRQEATREQQQVYDDKCNKQSFGMYNAVHIQDLVDRRKAVLEARMKRRLHKAKERSKK